jgi:hypothetical protein
MLSLRSIKEDMKMKTIEYFENLNNVMEDRKYIRQNVGQYVAYKNYKESVRLGADEFEVSDPPYNEEDTKEFIKTLEAAGVTRFFFTAKTTITIDFLTVCSELWWHNIHMGYMHRSNEILGEELIKGIWVETDENC